MKIVLLIAIIVIYTTVCVLLYRVDQRHARKEGYEEIR